MCLDAEHCHHLDRRRLLRLAGASAVAAGAATAVGAVPAAASPGTNRRGRGPAAELLLLGTHAGPPVVPGRAGISSALRVDGVNYVVDCGRASTTQYVAAGLRMRDLRSVFITHLHADHVADYYQYFLLGGSAPSSDDSRDLLAGPVSVYGPGPAGALPPAFGGHGVPTVHPEDPTPGIAGLTEYCHHAFAYSSNVFMRDSGFRDIRTLADVHEIRVPEVGAGPLGPTAPAMRPFTVTEDDRVRVTAVLVPHGPVYPAFAYRFDTDHGSVVFSGDTTYSDNLVRLSRGADVLVHEAINIEGAQALTPAHKDHLLESHVEIQKLGAIAQRAGVAHLVVSHLADFVTYPLDTRQWRRWAQRGYDGKVTVAQDLDRVPLTRRRP